MDGRVKTDGFGPAKRNFEFEYFNGFQRNPKCMRSAAISFSFFILLQSFDDRNRPETNTECSVELNARVRAHIYISIRRIRALKLNSWFVCTLYVCARAVGECSSGENILNCDSSNERLKAQNSSNLCCDYLAASKSNGKSEIVSFEENWTERTTHTVKRCSNTHFSIFIAHRA